MSKFRKLVRRELATARTKHPGRQNSLHEGYGVLVEEVREFEAEVFKRQSNRNPANVLSELVQIAAMAQRTAEDLEYATEDHKDAALDVLTITISGPPGSGKTLVMSHIAEYLAKLGLTPQCYEEGVPAGDGSIHNRPMNLEQQVVEIRTRQ